MTPAEERAAITTELIAICQLGEVAARLYGSTQGGIVMPTINAWNELRDAISAVNAVAVVRKI